VTDTTNQPTHETQESLSEEQAAQVIAEGRARIDALDDEIIALVQQRLQVSKRNQQARIAVGGGRVEHGRELEIKNHYAGKLGRPGGALALALLEVMRGSTSA
jgi:chorismate mutase